MFQEEKLVIPSTVIMNSVPAIVAGVKNICAAVPAPNNEVNAGVIYAAKVCGIKKIFRSWRSAGYCRLAYGTKTIDKVDKIVGPGNIFVATAKKEVFGQVGIDMIAGPSEITVIAGPENNPSWTALDLLSQAEHDRIISKYLINKNSIFCK